MELEKPDTLGEAEANYLRAKLERFLSLNPEANVRADGREPSVTRLWGDEAIEIPLRTDDEELFEVLNALRLPPRFTAIWHEDTRKFEVIYTVLDKENYIIDREFEFRYRGHSYHCSFDLSSLRLRAIARKARPSGSEIHSDFRNLLSFKLFEDMLEDHLEEEYVANRTPISFWINGIDKYDENLIVDLVRNLNFHMSYFDMHTPSIVIHEESVLSLGVKPLHLPETASFPNPLSGQDIDQHLLILWESARSGDPFLRFIHYYQILEYAGFYHVKEKIRREVERAIAAPDAVSRSDRVAQQMLDAISADKRTDAEKINAMIEECVDPRDLWRILEGSLSTFRKMSS